MAEEEFVSKIVVDVVTSEDTKQIEINENGTVWELKLETAEQFSTSVEQISLIFAGKLLEDKDYIQNENIKNGSTVYLVIEAKKEQQEILEKSYETNSSQTESSYSEYLELHDAILAIIPNDILDHPLVQLLDFQSWNNLVMLIHLMPVVNFDLMEQQVNAAMPRFFDRIEQELFKIFVREPPSDEIVEQCLNLPFLQDHLSDPETVENSAVETTFMQSLKNDLDGFMAMIEILPQFRQVVQSFIDLSAELISTALTTSNVLLSQSDQQNDESET